MRLQLEGIEYLTVTPSVFSLREATWNKVDPEA